MRAVLYQAAHALLIRSKKYSAIRVWGLGISKRRGLRRAAVAVARKLAVLMHRIWADGTKYRWQREAAIEA
jgi:transposase